MSTRRVKLAPRTREQILTDAQRAHRRASDALARLADDAHDRAARADELLLRACDELARVCQSPETPAATRQSLQAIRADLLALRDASM